MLKELRRVRQRPEEGFRRWFTDDDFDLIIWYTEPDGDLRGFQLCYNKRIAEQAITWQSDGSFTSSRIDTGESGLSRPKGSAQLVGSAAYSPQAESLLVSQFRNAADAVDDDLVELVCARLTGESQ